MRVAGGDLDGDSTLDLPVSGLQVYATPKDAVWTEMYCVDGACVDGTGEFVADAPPGAAVALRLRAIRAKKGTSRFEVQTARPGGGGTVSGVSWLPAGGGLLPLTYRQSRVNGVSSLKGRYRSTTRWVFAKARSRWCGR